MRISLVIAAIGLVAPVSTAQSTGGRAPPRCLTGSLVTYHVGDGATFDDDLVIGTDGDALLCWRRYGPLMTSGKATSGQTTFMISSRELRGLESALRRIGRQHLATRRKLPCCDMTTASLVYKGRAIPDDGVPELDAGIHALHSAESILNEIVERRTPDHHAVDVVQPVA